MSTEEQKQTGDLELGNGPGVGRVTIPEIDKAAETYVIARDKRVALSAKEVEAKKKLIDLMHANESKIGKTPEGEMRYVYQDGDEPLEVILFMSEEKLKVKAFDPEKTSE